jgi:hypothetical protein
MLLPRARQAAATATQQGSGVSEAAPEPGPSRVAYIPKDEYVEQLKSWDDTTPERISLLQPSAPLTPRPDSPQVPSWAQEHDTMSSSKNRASGRKKKGSKQELPHTLESDFYDAGTAAAVRQQGRAWESEAEEWGVERVTTTHQQHQPRQGAGSATGYKQGEQLQGRSRLPAPQGQQKWREDEGHDQVRWSKSEDKSRKGSKGLAHGSDIAGPEHIWTPQAATARAPPKPAPTGRPDAPQHAPGNGKGRGQQGSTGGREKRPTDWVKDIVSGHSSSGDQLQALLQVVRG